MPYVPSLFFKYSTMNAGKSTMLIQTAHNYRERNMEVLVLTPIIDNRYGSGVVTSRIGLQTGAQVLVPGESVLSLVENWIHDTYNERANVGAVLVDEAQFLDAAQVYDLAKVVDRLRIPVICYGLKSDFAGNLFPGSYHLLALANKLEEIPTICHCGKRATMVARVDESGKMVTSGPQVQIGGNDVYVSLCRRHWMSHQVTPIKHDEPTI